MASIRTIRTPLISIIYSVTIKMKLLICGKMKTLKTLKIKMFYMDVLTKVAMLSLANGLAPSLNILDSLVSLSQLSA